MLFSALGDNPNNISVSLDFLSKRALENQGSKEEEEVDLESISSEQEDDARRYLLLTYKNEFDTIRYPMSLTLDEKCNDRDF